MENYKDNPIFLNSNKTAQITEISFLGCIIKIETIIMTLWCCKRLYLLTLKPVQEYNGFKVPV